MRFFNFLAALALVTSTSNLFAQSEGSSTGASVMQTTVAPKWKATFDSFFYDFEGERPPENGLYEFGDTKLKMQLMGLSYQINPSWTMMVMTTYLDNFVVTKTAVGSVEDSTRGLGDTLVSALHTRFINPNLLLMTDVGLSLPTGSIDEKSPYFNDGTNYPYNMQMGSGTLDQTIGITPIHLSKYYQVGARFSAIFRTSGYNENNYRLGNQYKTDAWVDVPVGQSGFTPRLVGYYKHRDGIQGEDNTLRSQRVPLEYYYHDQINWDVSAAIKYTKYFTATVSLKAEAGVPLAQECLNYDDVAIYTQYYGTVGLSGSF